MDAQERAALATKYGDAGQLCERISRAMGMAEELSYTNPLASRKVFALAQRMMIHGAVWREELFDGTHPGTLGNWLLLQFEAESYRTMALAAETVWVQ